MPQNKDTKNQNIQDTTNPNSQITKIARRSPQGRPVAPNNDPVKDSDLMGYLD